MSTAVRRIERLLNSQTVVSKSLDISRVIQLPKIQLMEFSGDPLQWPKFWDLFRNSIHNRTDLSGATKFYYLITQLKGEAEQLMQGFDHTDGE